MTNLAMSILFEMSGEVVPEALGHNYPLFLADKKAKFVLSQSRKAYLGAVDVEMAKSDLDQQVLFSQRFRDYRSQVESQRKGGAMSSMASVIFDDLGGEFNGKLREIVSTTRQTADGCSTVTFRTAG